MLSPCTLNRGLAEHLVNVLWGETYKHEVQSRCVFQMQFFFFFFLTHSVKSDISSLGVNKDPVPV